MAVVHVIEERAWRVGVGELHTGFQRVSTLCTQLEVYTALGRCGKLSVHTDATPDTALPEQDAFLVYSGESDELANSWFVEFDGAGLDQAKCALLAEERELGAFYGFCTYDPDTVNYVIDHLSSTYLPVGGGASEPR